MSSYFYFNLKTLYEDPCFLISHLQKLKIEELYNNISMFRKLKNQLKEIK